MSDQPRLAAWLQAISEVWQWALDQLCQVAPARVRSWGWHDDAALFQLTDDESPSAIGIRQKSWLGQCRLRPGSSEQITRLGKQVYVISDKTVFRTPMTLSTLAARRGDTALDLRRDRFMPLTEGLGHYAYSIAPLGEDSERVELDIAVARLSDIETIQSHLPRDTHWSLVGSVDDQGRSDQVLARRAAPGLDDWIKPAIVYGLVLVALIVWQVRSEAQLGRAAVHQQEQANAVRMLRQDNAILDKIEDRRAIDGAPLYLGDLLQSLTTIPEQLNPIDRIERVRLTGDRALDIRLIDGRSYGQSVPRRTDETSEDGE